MSAKRKSDASASTSKKARTSTSSHASAKSLVNTILADSDSYPVSNDPDITRQSLVELALYARSLEGDVAVGAGASSNPQKTAEQIAEAAEKLRKAANSGIKKQMSWKPSCKQGSARWVYDGVCADPEVFGALLKLGGAPTFKMKKIPKDEFNEALGGITASVRYDTLYLTGDVTVRWQPEEGTFKLSGSYGKHQPTRDI